MSRIVFVKLHLRQLQSTKNLNQVGNGNEKSNNQ